MLIDFKLYRRNKTATRSSIAAKQEDGSIRIVYCHWDGYPDTVGVILLKHYNSLEKTNSILNLGDLSSLGPSVEKPEGHSFDTPVNGYSVFYGRDRGEAGTEAREYYTYDMALDDCRQE